MDNKDNSKRNIDSFAYYIETELGLKLDNIWNWEKNNNNGINPYKIKKQSNKKIWLYCLKHDYHNYDREGNRVGYEITCANFYNGRRCGYCKGNHKVHYKDSIAYNYPDIAKMIAIEENNLTFEDCYNISCYSNNKFYVKCLNCKIISRNRLTLSNISKDKYSCRVCGDGIPITEKIVSNILNQLNIAFKYQLTSKDFNWCNDYKYDFYIPKFNIIIETHGIQHYKNQTNNSKWQQLKDIQMNDLFKYKCAKSHVDNYIVIDCRYSTLEWLRENIIKELSPYFNLSNINWELAWEQSQKSKCVEAWTLWNNGFSTKEIENRLNLSKSTIIKYLKRGSECGKCNYTNGKKVICITTGKIFNTIREGASYYNMKSDSNITLCCKGIYKSAGKLEDGTKLIWEYYKDVK